MTSGTFRSLELSSIHIDRAKRQRRELRGLDELGESLRKNGQIHPILIQRETHELIAGERRHAAAQLIGWTHIMVQYEDEIDPLELKVLELEENTRRSDLTWQEQVLAIDEYHQVMAQREPGWTQEQTAVALNQSRQGVGQKLEVAKELKLGNKTVAQAPKYSTAKGIVERKVSRAAGAEIAAILEIEAAPKVVVEEAISAGDFHEWARRYSGPKFNFLHCDFPYGIGADQRHQGYTQEEFGGYADRPEDYFALLASLCSHLNNFCQEQAHIMFWFSMNFYSETMQFFAKNSPFFIDPFPLVWTKSDNIGLLPDPERGPRRIYETALFGSRGDRKIVRAVSNSIAVPSVRTDHMSEKSQLALEHFFRMFVDGSTSMFDPTAGSGSAVRAADALGASLVRGLETNVEFAKRANERLETQRRSKNVQSA